jgi:hypothetical protein
MRVILRYDSGFPTALYKHTNLAEIIRQAGPPQTISGGGASWLLEWPPIYPGVDGESYRLQNPWTRADTRKLIAVELEN